MICGRIFFYTLNFIYKESFCILSIKDGNVIARNVFRDEAIPWITPGDCSTAQNAGFSKKRLAMTPHHKLLSGHDSFFVTSIISITE
jgi:hypothetical protein